MVPNTETLQPDGSLLIAHGRIILPRQQHDSAVRRDHSTAPGKAFCRAAARSHHAPPTVLRCGSRLPPMRQHGPAGRQQDSTYATARSGRAAESFYRALFPEKHTTPAENGPLTTKTDNSN
jgi:hypothetical protein